jgi:hypothetical protein
MKGKIAGFTIGGFLVGVFVTNALWFPAGNINQWCHIVVAGLVALIIFLAACAACDY